MPSNNSKKRPSSFILLIAYCFPVSDAFVWHSSTHRRIAKNQVLLYPHPITRPSLEMTAKDIDGKSVAESIRSELASKLASLPADVTSRPGLAVMLVGSRKDSQTYVRMKQKACADCGMVSFLEEYPKGEDVTEEMLLAKIRDWNEDEAVHGILVQLPLPKHIHEERILSEVDPKKDVDGLHPANTAKLFSTATHAGAVKLNWKDFTSIPFHIPCTPQGCIELLDRINDGQGIEIEGKNAVVIGRSNLVGMPVAMLLLHRNATITIVHSRTKNIESIIQQADIVVAAVGRANMVQASWLKPGCVVIDVGINSVDAPDTKRGYKLVGDVNYAEAKEVCEWITPVPGGVGPMTIAMLLRNTWNSWRRATGQMEG
eukprot:CCRYP_020748-RA/>CCRYP_020748-RA protein AED:0.06 eAED:0.06 QI:75/1/1/1/1/1/2/77/371